jgi:phage/plasmid-like protein (TIGR03299 family)
MELVPEMGSDVIQAPVFAPYGDPTAPLIAESERWMANVRELDGKILGIQSGKYTVWQTREMLAFADEVVGEANGAHIKTAGTLKDGSLVWALLELPGEINIGGTASEAMRPYLMVTNSFDGSCAATSITTWVRVVCANTWNMAMGQAKVKYSVRHTSQMDVNAVDAQEALRMTFNLGDEIQKVGDVLIAQKMGAASVASFLRNLVPLDPNATKIVRDNTLATRHDIGHIFLNSPTTGDAAGTKWGALQAVTEYTQRYQNAGQSSAARMSKVMLATPALNTRALAILTA